VRDFPFENIKNSQLKVHSHLKAEIFPAFCISSPIIKYSSLLSQQNMFNTMSKQLDILMSQSDRPHNSLSFPCFLIQRKEGELWIWNCELVQAERVELNYVICFSTRRGYS